MKKIVIVALLYIFIFCFAISAMAYSSRKIDFLNDSKKYSIEISIDDKSLNTDCYMLNDWCFINFEDCIKFVTDNYKILNNNKINSSDKTYIAKTNINNIVYYFWTEQTGLVICDIDRFLTFGVEKMINGKLTEVYTSLWKGTNSIELDGKQYVDITSLPLIYQDFGYIAQINMADKKINLIADTSRNNKYISEFEKSNKVKLNFDNGAISLFNYYQGIVDQSRQYEAYKGLTEDNAYNVCKQLYENIWGVSVEDINIKYDNALDSYIVFPKGKCINDKDALIYGDISDYRKIIVVRKFDGQVLYPF